VQPLNRTLIGALNNQGDRPVSEPSQPPTPPPGKGPAERRWTAAYNQAGRTGDLLTLELLDEAWSAAWRESAGTEPGQSREERAETAWAIYRRGTQET
jgi:hypothetical protein